MLAAVAVGLFFALRPDPSQPAASPGAAIPQGSPDALAVTVVPVELRTLTESIVMNAHVAASKEVGVAPKLSGTVASVAVDVGDAVEEGQALLHLEDEELRAQYQQAVAALELAEANLARLKAGATPEEREQAAAAVRQAALNLEQAQRQLERIEQLFAENVVSQEQVEAARTQFGISKAQLEAAEQQLRRLEQGATPEDIRAAEAQVAQARAARELAQLQLDYAQVKAPFSGIVSRRDVEPGRLVQGGVPVITIVDMDRVYVRGAVSQAHVGEVRVGEPVAVRVAAAGISATGRIYSVSPAADSAGLFPIRVEVDNPGHRLKPGMFATVEIPLRRAEDSVAVPIRALVRRGDERAVFVVEPLDNGTGDNGPVRRRGVARLRIIEVGIEDGDWIQVVRGLEPGEQVVAAGQAFLSDGREVTWTQEE